MKISKDDAEAIVMSLLRKLQKQGYIETTNNPETPSLEITDIHIEELISDLNSTLSVCYPLTESGN